MLEGGGWHIEDLREIQDYRALRQAIGLRRMPSLSTFGDWLVRQGGSGGVEAMVVICEEVGGEIGKGLATPEYTLDVDATIIEAEKKEAQWASRKVKGYQPILGFLAENGVCLRREFRGGNVASQSGALEFFRRLGVMSTKRGASGRGLQLSKMLE